MRVAPGVPVRTHVESFPLEQANEGLAALRAGVEGAVALVVDDVRCFAPT